MTQTTDREADKDAGYTLTEMLIVIVILGLIAAAVTPGVVGQLARARAKSATLQMETLSSALEAYRNDVGHYPTRAENLNALMKAPVGDTGWLGPYVRSQQTLLDPWTAPWRYKGDEAGDTYVLESYGADKKPGGASFDADLHTESAGAR